MQTYQSDDKYTFTNRNFHMLLCELFTPLFEAKSVRDFRHDDISDQFKYWGTKTVGYIDPTDGFNFIYDKGELLLFSTNNEVYSSVVAKNLWKKKQELEKAGKSTFPLVHGASKNKESDSDLWNQLGGTVLFKDKTITFSKEDVDGKSRQRVVNDVKDFQSALKNILSYGVTSDFKIKGLPSPYNGMTVGDALQLQNPMDEILKPAGQIMFHGTSLKRWEESIQSQGLRPGNTGETYVDLIPGYSEHNIYLASNAKTAEFYGKRQAKKDDDEYYVVLEITVPDASKFLPDDHFAHNLKKEYSFRQSKQSLKSLGSIAYKGIIRPKFIKLHSKKKA